MKKEPRAYIVEFDNVPSNLPANAIPGKLLETGARIVAAGRPSEVYPEELEQHNLVVNSPDNSFTCQVEARTDINEADFDLMCFNRSGEKALAEVLSDEEQAMYDHYSNYRGAEIQIADAFDNGETLYAVHNLLTHVNQIIAANNHTTRRNLYRVIGQDR